MNALPVYTHNFMTARGTTYGKIIGAILLLTKLVCIHQTVEAQSSFEAFLYAGPGESEKLTEAYLAPLVLGLSHGMCSGWYNTAATHHPLGFDLTVTASSVFVPSSATRFNPDPTIYSHIRVAESEGLPTAIGPSAGTEARFNYTDQSTGQQIEAVKQIEGIGLMDRFGYNMIPAPIVQLGFGTFWNTDIIVRYMPEMQFGDFSTSVFGLGIKHDVVQWIPALQRLPLDMAVLAAFGGFDNQMDMDTGMAGAGQEAIFDVNGWTIQGICSKEFSAVTLYGALGYGSVTSTMQMRGVYALEGEEGEIAVEVRDPMSICYKDGAIRATAGFRMKLALLTIHADYTIQRYHMLNVGIGFSFR